ncbi:hypothetical protein GH714_025401 [Hevea brasiliensis]|uniref:tRNA (guanine-N(7)-)-methyltransferase non-catalytic subunit n=1 Tax=Hevea brasiliensis TaxID=3981 RepID=A0A6A6NJ09_HEVBR|nr:hypothetical protein GH714_025401 [Hevea brasiliensis]
MTGLGDDIYVIGGVIGPDRWNWYIKPMSDVDILTVGGERPTWRQAAPMTRCRGAILGYEECNFFSLAFESSSLPSTSVKVVNVRGGCGVSLVDDSAQPFHKDSIRAIRYSANGKLLVSAADDKLVKIWSTDSWRCVSSVNLKIDQEMLLMLNIVNECFLNGFSPLRLSQSLLREKSECSCYKQDGLYVCFADKFGVVWVVDLHELEGNESLVSRKAAPLLAHYCSIITSLEFSPDGQFIVSADRDFKIRVTVFPKKPLDGAHEIQSFCLGHTEFVSCLAFICTMDYPQGFLVSGSGDSTVRLWDITSGFLLDTCEVGAKAGLLESNRSDEGCSTVSDLCIILDGNLIAVAIQSLQGIMLLHCDLSSRTLNVIKVVSIMGESFIPTSLGSSSHAELLWMVTGVSKLSGSDCNSLARVRVLSGFKKSNPDSVGHELTVMRDDELPGAEKLLEKLQGSVSLRRMFF